MTIISSDERLAFPRTNWRAVSVAKHLTYVLAISVALLGQAHPQNAYCAMKADSTTAVRTHAGKFTQLQNKVNKFWEYIAADYWMKRRLPYEQWDQIRERFAKDVVGTSAFSPRHRGEPSLLMERNYRREMAALISKPFGFDWANGNDVHLLVDGPASFRKRRELIEHAQESVYMFAWAFYEDARGWSFADSLIDAKLKRLCVNADLDIKIIVDGNVASRLGYHDVLEYLTTYPAFKNDPIRVVYLNDKQDPYFGMHRKVMIVDRAHLIMGGMNVGNGYSHDYSDPGGWWRDTDVYVEGPVVNQALMTFVHDWNEQRGYSDLAYQPVKYGAPLGKTVSMIIDHQPLRDENIHIAAVKAFYGATQTIDIENAYFIADPVIEKAILDALERGVRVRILSNSEESIDEPMITTPILDSLARLAKNGAQVYTKKVYGDSTTLHSKVLAVDGIFSWIGSHNFHPRSYRYEREVVLASFDPQLTAEYEAMFEEDIAPDKANRLTRDGFTGRRETLFDKLLSSKFFDQL
jgi:cardiolipin synthase A/B